jgi:hypothetical protein
VNRWCTFRWLLAKRAACLSAPSLVRKEDDEEEEEEGDVVSVKRSAITALHFNDLAPAAVVPGKARSGPSKAFRGELSSVVFQSGLRHDEHQIRSVK